LIDDVFEVLTPAELAQAFPPPADVFEIATPEETEKAFGYLATMIRNSDKRRGRGKGQTPIAIRPVCFIDGEGSNIGEPVHTVKDGLTYSNQLQHYSLLGVTYEDGRYEKIIGENNDGHLSTRQCLEFITSIPEEYIIISYGFGYDVEQMLFDVELDKMQILHKSKWLRWTRYRLNYIPGKYFFVESRDRKRKIGKLYPRRRIYDIAGFFGHAAFAKVTRKWNVATPAEQEFLERHKDDRENFGPITEDTCTYNALEGKLGIRVFQKIRAEWTKLELRISSPHGAGALSGAMFVKNDVANYMQPQQFIPPSPIKRAYLGGRFDFTRQGQFGSAYEYDINSAYPHHMRSLPCLTHIRTESTRDYVEDQHSLWLVQWSDTDKRWSPFPYRDDKRIRYHSSGIGWYYGSEVSAALRFDPTISILDGIRFIPQCECEPFKWIESYYLRRQAVKESEPYLAEVLKTGMNGGYGKLAQTKGFTPSTQCLIWAGMITSATRAQLLDAMTHDPESVIAMSTDSILSLKPLPLDLHETRLGAWKCKTLPDIFLLGNGFGYSSDGQKDTHRGFPKWDWEIAKAEWFEKGYITATSNDYNRSHEAITQHKPNLRRTWTKRESRLEFNPPRGREPDTDGWLWPSTNPHPWTISDEIKVDDENLRVSQFGYIDSVFDFGDTEKLIEIESSEAK